jgi:hypothetical protein
VKNYPLTPDFSLAKNRRREWLSRVRMRYRKAGEWKDIKSDFYANDSLNVI